MDKQIVLIEDLGLRPYKEVWDYQEELLQKNLKAKAEIADSLLYHHAVTTATRHYLLMVEHLPVYTLGKSGREEHILMNDEMRKERGIEYFKINRGGDITFHGPEQLVGYPILDLEKFKTDISWYLRNLEEVIIKTIAHYGLKGQRSPGETGVWIDSEKKGSERKICAMGVRCSRWITMHGWALNVNTDLGYFDDIIPCGIKNKQVTSMKKELGLNIPIDEVKKVLKEKFKEVFEVDIV